jgi:pimeloyl-ACP methyl ester carboxylesterase
MKRFVRRGTVGLAAGALLATLLVGGATAASAGHVEDRDGCHRLTLAVTISDGGARDQSVAATYCTPRRWDGPRQVDVLTAGSTYTRSYWDWPQDPERYSYVDRTLRQGHRAVLFYDRLGAGQSSHPASTAISIAADAFVLHQLVDLVKSWGYRQVNAIGHSYGSGITLREAATYHDVTRVVLTGYLNVVSNPAVVAASYPANQDPAFAGQGLDDGYRTTRPGAREAAFYAGRYSPRVAAFDEAHKDLVSGTGFGGYAVDKAAPAGASPTNQITAPVLLIDGQRDAVFCFDPTVVNCADVPGLRAHEAPYFTSARSMTLVVVPDTGHDLALHRTAQESFGAINRWIRDPRHSR